MTGGVRQWWLEREPREKLLLAVAGALCVLIAAYQFAFMPSSAFRAEQERAFSAALSEYAYVSSVTDNMMETRSDPSREQPLQAVLTNTSGLYGLTISRLVPAEADGMNVWLDSASPQLLFAWVADLERSHGVRVERAAIRRNQEGDKVTANLFLQRQE